MAANLIGKYVWLVDTIQKAEKITFQELSDLWRQTEMSGGVELSKRTFHKWRNDVEELLGLVIQNEGSGQYRYFIESEDNASDMKRWLMDTISVGNILANNSAIRDRILLENVPSGRWYLSDIIDAMERGLQVTFTYRHFGKKEEKDVTIAPLCVKLFKQRWYVLAHFPDGSHDTPRVYGLDRIKYLEITDQPFEMPEGFDAEKFFADNYGVFVCGDEKAERIVVRVSAQQRPYVETLPWHRTQRLISEDENSCVFEYRLRPTLDFIQEIMSHHEDVEVLEPESVRKEVKRIVKAMAKMYHLDKG